MNAIALTSSVQPAVLNAPRQQQALPDSELFETMLWQNGIRLQAFHLDRMSLSAAFFGRAFERQAAETMLYHCVKLFDHGTRFQVCLRLAEDGALHLTSQEYIPVERYGLVRMADEPTHAEDVFRSHQTTSRKMYDRLLPVARSEGLDDLLFCNHHGELTEGAAHSVFIKHGNVLLTPPLHCGVLPGVYRRFVLENYPRVQEEVLRTSDLFKADAVYLTSSLTGMFPVQVIG